MKLGARGISILFASGDSGVGCNDAGSLFVPGFPASSPWVTAIGGTMTDYFFEEGPEIVNGLSGGGFSNFFEYENSFHYIFLIFSGCHCIKHKQLQHILIMQRISQRRHFIIAQDEPIQMWLLLVLHSPSFSLVFRCPVYQARDSWFIT